MKFGLCLYSLREQIKTEEGLEQVTRSLAEMGYSFLQFSGSPLPLSSVKAVSDRTGMPFPLTHSPLDRILNDTDKLMQEHAAFGCRNIGIGCIPNPMMRDEQVAELARDLERTAVYMEKHGFRLHYHHHHFEFRRMASGQTILEYFISNAPHLYFIPDTYWVQYGGGDILELAKALKGRISCVHLKDYQIVCTGGDWDVEPAFACVGGGTLRYDKIIPALRAAGAELFIVEQDNATELPDGMEQLRRSAEYLKQFAE